MKIGITGASGQLGHHVVAGLKQNIDSSNIVAIVRTVEKAKDLGVEIRYADYEKPETLNQALQGIETLVLISANEIGKRANQHKNVIEAAKNSGINWIIYTSLLRADSSTINLADEHLVTEKMIKETGIPYTILRNGWYTENYASSVQGAVAQGALIGSAGEGRISAAARADYAKAIVSVLTTGDHKGKTYELAGDDSFTMDELATAISEATNKDIKYRNLPVEDYAIALTGTGIPEPIAKALASWDVAASKGDLYDNTHQLSGLIGRNTTDYRQTVKEIVKQ